MPLSWHMPMSKEPFIYAVAIRDENYTHHLLQKNKEFALNFLDISYVEAFERTGKSHGNEVDKFLESTLHKKKPSMIKSTLIQEAYMIYECLVIDKLNYGDHDVFIAQVKCIHNAKGKNVSPTLFMGKGIYETISNEPKQVQR